MLHLEKPDEFNTCYKVNFLKKIDWYWLKYLAK